MAGPLSTRISFWDRKEETGFAFDIRAARWRTVLSNFWLRQTTIRQMSAADEKVAAEISSREAASLIELRDIWENLYRVPAPKGISRKLMVRAIAYQIQVKTFGGLKPSIRRKLMSSLKRAEDGEKKTKARSPIIPYGTRFVREWNGRTYIVDAVEGGFLFDRKTYKSLSAIARHITGAHWNGRRFFGVDKTQQDVRP